jgi:uncharacterized membrane protein YkvA (DUF1232 family)
LSSRMNKWKIIWNLPRLIQKSWLLFKNPATPRSRKTMLLLLSLGYLIWPIDLIPDLPLLGYFDDLGVLFLLLNWFVKKPLSNSADSIEAEYYYVDEDKKEK